MNLWGEKYKEHVETGLCTFVHCQNPCVPGRRLCEVHREIERVRQIERRIRYKKEGRCPHCSGLLHPQMDEGYVNCIFCREKIGINYV